MTYDSTAASPMAGHVLVFGDFRLDPAARELRRGAHELAIAPKCLDCLLHLVAHRDRAVPREELVARIWGHGHITDGALSQTVLQLRRLLGDGEDGRFIKSVRGYGYRWVAPTHSEINGTEPGSARAQGTGGALTGPQQSLESSAFESTGSGLPKLPTSASPHSSFRRRRPPAWLALSVLIVLLALLALAFVPTAQRPAPSLVEVGGQAPPLVLVLPVQVDDEGAAPWLRLGGMDLLAARLRDSGLTVVPAETVLQLLRMDVEESREPSAQRLARATGAEVLLRVDARRVEHRWAVSVRGLTQRGPRPALRAESDDALDALQRAAAVLATELGASAAPAGAVDPQLLRLRHRVQAALLEQRYDLAAQLLEEAPVELRHSSELRLLQADIQFRRREFAQARDGFERLIESPELQRNPPLQDRARAALGVSLAALGEVDAAAGMMSELVQRSEPALEPRLAAHLHYSLAVLRLGEGDRDVARRHLAQARRLLTGGGDIQSLARLDLAAGLLESQHDRHFEALDLLERAAAGFDAIGDTRGSIRALSATLSTQLQLLDVPAAAVSAARLQSLLAGHEPLNRQPEALLVLAMFDRDRGAVASARAALDRLLSDPESHDSNFRSRLTALELRAQWTLEDGGDPEEALRDARAVTGSARARRDAQLRGLVASAWLSEVRAALASADRAAAHHARGGFEAWEGRDDTPAGRTYAHLMRAALADSADRPEAAADHYRQAQQEAEASRSPRLLLEAARARIGWLLRQPAGGPEALALVDRLGRHADRHFDAALLRAQVLQHGGPSQAGQHALRIAESLAGERQIRIVPAAGPLR
jgi:DNA-binding winged helix-turn-helix (wHTH) protein/tetratricopeptide (TPR) repeat protein